jgi:hypothetical protein
MDLHYRLSRDLHAHDIRFPFPSTWTSLCGEQAVSHGALTRVSRPGAQCLIPAEKLFSFAITPGVEGHASGRLSLHTAELTADQEPDWRSLERVFETRTQRFGLALAQAMFMQPDHAWSLQEICEALAITEREIRTRLFREDYGFASTLRRCRALHLLLGALCHDFPNTLSAARSHRADSVLSSAFNVRLATLSRIRLPLSPREI